MSSLDGISPLSAAPPDLRPELDRAKLQSYQLSEVYNLQEQRMVTPIGYRDLHEGIETADPLLYDAFAGPREGGPAVDVAPHAASRVPAPATAESWSPGALSADRAADAGRGENASDAGPSGGSAKDQPALSELPPATAALPYGADPVRIRQLVDAIAEGYAFVPLAYHYRQAGDLSVVKTSADNAAATRQVVAVQKAI